jgi:hypothetical protein
MSEGWVLGANDNDWVGWGITVAYLVAAALCFVCGRRMGAASPSAAPISASVVQCFADAPVSPASNRRERWLWWCVGAAVLLLGINKQLDLQTLLRDLGRAMAETEGWYGYRRLVQMGFVAATAVIALGTLILAGVRVRRTWRQHALLYAGVVILAGFVVLRVATFHHVRDSIEWSAPIRGARFLMEAAGIACIGVSAMMQLRRMFSSSMHLSCSSLSVGLLPRRRP